MFARMAATGSGLLALLLWAGAGAEAQTTTLDEGVFTHSVQGRRVATESFNIRRSGSGDAATIIAQARVIGEGDAQTLRASVQTEGASFRPSAYEIIVEGADRERVTGRISGNRISAQIASPSGEMMREYIASDGALIIDSGVAHQYFFLAQRLDGASFRVPVIIPRQSRQVSATVTPGGNESISIAGRNVTARRIVVEVPGDGQTILWIDDQGRVLRVDVPARGFSAERNALPGT